MPTILWQHTIWYTDVFPNTLPLSAVASLSFEVIYKNTFFKKNYFTFQLQLSVLISHLSQTHLPPLLLPPPLVLFMCPL